MKASDVMTSEVISVSPGHSINHAARVMMQHHVSGLPVLDDDGKLAGMLTEGDLIRRAEIGSPDVAAVADQMDAAADTRAKAYIKSHSWCVGDVMTGSPITVDESTPIGRIAEIMMEHDIKRVPVMRDEHLVGIVSRADLLRGIVTATGDQTAEGDNAVRLAVLTRLGGDVGLSPGKVGVTVRNGWVLLWGRVDEESQRDAARVAAETVNGVKGVTNHLRIMDLPADV